MARDPRFLSIFRQMAKESQHSYVEICGDHLYLIYFPGTGRYQWCDATGPITREKALKWLLSTEALPRSNNESK